MANYNLTNQPISASFQQLLQKNDSDFLVDGTGSLIQSLKVTGSISSSTYYGDGSNLTGISGGAVATGSLLKTASFDNGTRNMTFTKGDSSTFDVNIPGGSVDTGSLIETASIADATITFTKADASQFSIEVDNVTSSLESQDLFINVKNTSGSPISKGLAIHATGVTGENVNIELADSTNSANMPAIGILNETLANNATGKAIISGRIKNIDTSALVAGAPVYVNGAGTLTANKPTGSDLIQNIGICGKVNATEGEIIVEGSGRTNDLPNLTSGYIWLGNNNGVPAEFSTGSIAFTNKNNTFTGTQNFSNISVSGTGSFGYIQSVTGSAKIIGDAFLILNNDTPAERYAGIKVYDSGSTRDTASFQWDGQTHDWFYEFSSSAAHEYGVALFGPEYTTLGTPTYLTNNTIPKGSGGHHLNDSNITDDGSTVTIGSDLNVTGTYKGFDSGSFAILNQSNTFTTGPQIVSGSSNTYFQSSFGQPTNNQILFFKAPDAEVGGTAYPLTQFGYANYLGFGNEYSSSLLFEANRAGYTGGAELGISGKEVFIQMRSVGEAFGQRARMRFRDVDSGASEFRLDANDIYIGTGANTSNVTLGSSFISTTVNSDLITNNDLIASGAVTFVAGNDFNCNKGAFFNSATAFNSNVTATAPISSSTYISASAFIGDGSQLTGIDAGIFAQTGSFYSTTNDLQVTGSFGVSKAIGGKNSDLTISSNTASIDLTTSNTFTVTLVSSADTHLDVSTFGEDAQSVNILVKQPAAGNTGSISFSPDFKFGQGYSYTPTSANSAEDILSFTRFSNSLYGTYINNFS